MINPERTWRKVDMGYEYKPGKPHQQPPTAPEIEVDSIAFWLLRCGIDHTGELSLTSLWDIAIRGAILADLRSTGLLRDDTDGSIFVHADPTGVAYVDAACQVLLGYPNAPEERFLLDDAVRAHHVADRLVETGEWQKHFSIAATQLHRYTESPPQQRIPQRRRLAHILDGDITGYDYREGAIARLGHALNVVRPALVSRQPRSDPPSAGPLEDTVSATALQIVERAAEVRAAAVNPTW